jgi:hypothetical protein
MGQFIGFVTVGNTAKGKFVARNGSRVPVNADALPTFRAYGPAGTVMANGTGSLSLADSGAVSNATNASPVVITSNGHGLSTGTRVTVAGVGGNTAANGTFQITQIDANTFSLDSSNGNGAYTSGGAWNVTGAYTWSLDVTSGNGYTAGENYRVLITSVVSGVTYEDVDTFAAV